MGWIECMRQLIALIVLLRHVCFVPCCLTACSDATSPEAKIRCIPTLAGRWSCCDILWPVNPWGYSDRRWSAGSYVSNLFESQKSTLHAEVHPQKFTDSSLIQSQRNDRGLFFAPGRQLQRTLGKMLKMYFRYHWTKSEGISHSVGLGFRKPNWSC